MSITRPLNKPIITGRLTFIFMYSAHCIPAGERFSCHTCDIVISFELAKAIKVDKPAMSPVSRENHQEIYNIYTALAERKIIFSTPAHHMII